jgi:hypothetical protein
VNRSKVTGAAVLVALVAVGAVLATQREWPFSNTSKHAIAQTSGGGSTIWKGKPKRTRPAEEIWSGEVLLVLNQHYGLDKRPGKTSESCGACLTVGSSRRGGLFLHSDNGILPWPKQERPSYADCIHQRESGTLDAVTLETSPHDGGLAVHGWLCATGNEGDIIRLQYQGQGKGGTEFRFAVTAWYRPFA